jgi:hypothetical protein
VKFSSVEELSLWVSSVATLVSVGSRSGARSLSSISLIHHHNSWAQCQLCIGRPKLGVLSSIV